MTGAEPIEGGVAVGAEALVRPAQRRRESRPDQEVLGTLDLLAVLRRFELVLENLDAKVRIDQFPVGRDRRRVLGVWYFGKRVLVVCQPARVTRDPAVAQSLPTSRRTP